MHVNVYINIHMYTYIHTYICIHTYIHRKHTYAHTSNFISLDSRSDLIEQSLCTSLYMYMQIHEHVYTYIHIGFRCEAPIPINPPHIDHLDHPYR